jgi:radical SAM protein with 4Fe4S-binding SPASM domain
MIEVVSYGEFSQGLHRQVQERRIPAEVSIEVTRRCPLACVHCYNNLPMSDRAARDSELTFEEHCRLLDELAEAGCLWLLYTGGEIFARKDFLDIYTYARRKGFLITLFTNGTMITPQIADYLLEWRPFSIEITLYGRTREIYERLTGVAGSYERCLRGINLLRERGLPVKLKSVAVTINKHEIWQMQQFAREELKLEFKFDAMMSPRIDCSQSPLAVRLTPEETVELDLQDPARVHEWQRFAAQFDATKRTAEATDELYHCGGGVNSLAIDPQGRMSICVLSHVDAYPWREGGFSAGWDDYLLKVRQRKSVRLTKCRQCAIKSVCGMCPANGELENKDAEQPVDFLCHVAHLRAEVMGFAAPPHGDCEYCAGGSRHPGLMESTEILRERYVKQSPAPVGSNSRSRYLPVVAETNPSVGGGCGSGGCSSCH